MEDIPVVAQPRPQCGTGCVQSQFVISNCKSSNRMSEQWDVQLDKLSMHGHALGPTFIYQRDFYSPIWLLLASSCLFAVCSHLLCKLFCLRMSQAIPSCLTKSVQSTGGVLERCGVTY